MLELKIPEIPEIWDEKNECFDSVKAQTLQLEHSLVSISKWEAKWHLPFLTEVRYQRLTNDQLIDYIKCMTITKNVPDIVYRAMLPQQVQEIIDYINDPATATTFVEDNSPPNFEVLTSEVIYWEMINFGIWKECEKWNINRLVTLIRVCNEKNKKGQRMSEKEIYAQNAAVNAARRRMLHTRG